MTPILVCDRFVPTITSDNGQKNNCLIANENGLHNGGYVFVVSVQILFFYDIYYAMIVQKFKKCRLISGQLNSEQWHTFRSIGACNQFVRPDCLVLRA